MRIATAPLPPEELADKIERQIKLYKGLSLEVRFVMDADASKAMVELLRKTGELIDEVNRLRTELIIRDILI